MDMSMSVVAERECLESAIVDVDALLRRVIDGDQRAWDEIVGRFGGLVWSVARSYRLGASTDDVVQTVWLRLAEHCDRIREPHHLAAWLATTTRNEALRVANKQGRSLPFGEVPEQADATSSLLDELAVDDDTLVHVRWSRSDSCPNRTSNCCVWCAPSRRSTTRTIASMLERSIGSIGPSRARALGKLRQLLPAGLYEDTTGTRKDEVR